jgi:hypothetical protein
MDLKIDLKALFHTGADSANHNAHSQDAGTPG